MIRCVLAGSALNWIAVILPSADRNDAMIRG